MRSCKYIILLVYFLLPASVWGAAYSTTATGTSWHVAAHWNPEGVPGNGDTATIAHDTTVSQNTIIGNSPAAGNVVLTINSGKTLTIDSGIELTVRGDASVNAGSLAMSAGAKYHFDSSLQAGNPVYQMLLLGANALDCNGTSGSHCVVDRASGSGVGVINWQSDDFGINCVYTDFSNLGTSTAGAGTDAVYCYCRDPGDVFVFDHCTFTSCSRVYVYVGAGNNCEITSCVWGAVVGNYGLWVYPIASTGGTRIISDTFHSTGISTQPFVLEGNLTGLVVQRCVLGTVLYSGCNGASSTWSGNLIYSHSGAASASEIGEGGLTVTDTYFAMENGLAGETGYINPDAAFTGGVATYNGLIIDTTANHEGADFWQCPAPVAATTYLLKRVIVLPQPDGGAGGNITHHGSASTTTQFEHCTLMAPNNDATADGAIILGASYDGHSGMVSVARDNLVWAKTQPAAGGHYIDQIAGIPQANVITPAGAVDNAFYNCRNGECYDAGGGTPYAVLAYDNLRSASTYGSGDLDLGTGADEMSGGPLFVDSTRNLATADISCFGNAAGTAWADATAYVVGDIVSAQTAGFYANININYRCILNHTSAAGHATNGKPAVAASFRTNWEFASIHRIRQDTSKIATLYLWVSNGFKTKNTSLRNAGHDGVTIGACEFLSTSVPNGVDTDIDIDIGRNTLIRGNALCQLEPTLTVSPFTASGVQQEQRWLSPFQPLDYKRLGSWSR